MQCLTNQESCVVVFISAWILSHRICKELMSFEMLLSLAFAGLVGPLLKF